MPLWQAVGVGLLVLYVVLQLQPVAPSVRYEPVPLHRNTPVLRTVERTARAYVLDHLPATQPYQELSYQEEIAPNPSTARYYRIRLEYRTMDQKAQPVIEVMCFLFSKTGRLTLAQVCE